MIDEKIILGVKIGLKIVAYWKDGHEYTTNDLTLKSIIEGLDTGKLDEIIKKYMVYFEKEGEEEERYKY